MGHDRAPGAWVGQRIMTSTEDQPGTEGARPLQPFASFRYRNYRWLWTTNVSYGLVQSSQRFALVWLAIETLEAADSYLGLVILMATLPTLLLALPAGVLTDRVDKRSLLVTSHMLMALVLVLAAILSGTQAISQGLVLVLAFLAGIGIALGEPVRLALVPTVVPTVRLLNANALYSLAQGLGGILGPALAGMMVALWAPEGAFAVLAVVIAAGALFLIPLRIPPRYPSSSSEKGGSSNRLTLAGMVEDIVDGFRFAFSGTTEVRSLFVLLLTFALLAPGLALDSGDVANRLDVSAFGATLLFAGLGVGGLITVLILASVQRLPNAGGWYGVMLVVGVIAIAVIWVYTYLVPVGLAPVAALMLFSGLALGGHTILFRTLVQSQTPASLLGRAMGTYLFILAIGAALSSLVTWGASDALRDDPWILLAALIMLAVTLAILVRQPSLRRMPSG